MSNFDGQLKTEELSKLREANFTDDEIRQIQAFVLKYCQALSGFEDLVGDELVPSGRFIKNIKKMGYLLDNDPRKVISKKDIILRKTIFSKIVRAMGPTLIHSEQIFENRNRLCGSDEVDRGIDLPKDAVIWASNHHFTDDAMASVLAAKRPVYFLFGSIPVFYNGIEGDFSHLIGSLLVNRKSHESRSAAIAKVKRCLNFGMDVLMYPEGVHNKTPNELVLPLWNGIYRIANENGNKIVPIIHYIYDVSQNINKKNNPIHTVVDEPIDLTQYTEKAGLEYLREVFATWYYLMMEKYGYTTREVLMEYYEKRAITEYGQREEEFEKRRITSHEAFEIYLTDYLKTIKRYDHSAETTSDYRPADRIRPEDVWKSVAHIKSTQQNVYHVLYARDLIRKRQAEDYQRRF